MKQLIVFLLLSVIWMAGAGCKKTPPPQPQTIVKTGGRELVGMGVKFLIPWEDSSGHSDSPVGFTYESPTMRVTMHRGVFYVNATNYGAVKSGDVVNLLNPGRVLVNDQERTQQPTTGMFRE